MTTACRTAFIWCRDCAIPESLGMGTRVHGILAIVSELSVYVQGIAPQDLLANFRQIYIFKKNCSKVARPLSFFFSCLLQLFGAIFGDRVVNCLYCFKGPFGTPVSQLIGCNLAHGLYQGLNKVQRRGPNDKNTINTNYYTMNHRNIISVMK
jgi:hypothetical protein